MKVLKAIIAVVLALLLLGAFGRSNTAHAAPRPSAHGNPLAQARVNTGRRANRLNADGMLNLVGYGRDWKMVSGSKNEPRFVPSASLVLAAGMIVNDLGDGPPASDGKCTLREAILNANNNNQSGSTDCAAGSGTDTIGFSISGTITLGSTLPAVNDDLTIDGSGQSITVSGNTTVQVLRVNSSKTVNLNSLTIANGLAANCGGYLCGGGIFNNDGTLNVTNSTFSNNSAPTGYGAGIYNNYYATLTVTNSTFSGNTGYVGVGIGSDGGDLTVTNSTFVNNSVRLVSGSGGGIYMNGTMTVTNSTFANNSSTYGGGAIANGGGTLTVVNSTFANNSSVYGGGISNDGGTTLKNTILVNSSGGNCDGGVTADSYNLTDDTTCGSATQKTSAQINLAPLGDNGGPTQTFALMSTSVAIDAGDNTVCAVAVDSSTSGAGGKDQRGNARDDLHCDAGAFEVKYNDTNTVSKSNLTVGTAYTFGPTLGKVVVNNGNPGTVQFTKYLNNPTGKPNANGFDREWNITATASSFSLTLTLCYTDAELETRAEANLKIYHYTGGQWVALPSTVDAANNCVAASGITSLSPFTLAPSAPTAVTLISFAAKPTRTHRVRVKWQTGNELDVVGFNVWQRQGKGKWQRINHELIVPKHPGGIVGAAYTFVDKRVMLGKPYEYKLEIAHAGGTNEWSEVKRVTLK